MKIKFLIPVFITVSIFTVLLPDYLVSGVIEVPGDYTTIQAAIDAAVNGDTVLVAEGTYFENLQITSKSITLASHFLSDGDTIHISKTIIDGSQPVNTNLASVIMVNFSLDTTVICGLTITGGYGMKVAVGNEFARVGGGIAASASNIMIHDNRIINNAINQAKVPDSYTAGASGGGIGVNPLAAENLSIIIRNNLIADNYVESKMTGGGGIALVNFYDINYIIENNIISNNSIQNTDEWKAMGGGIAMNFTLPTSGTQIIRTNLISGNKALCQGSFGGAMYIVLEERTSGGVVDNDPGPFIYNNIFEGNHSDHLGGAIAVWRVYWPEGDVRAWPLTSAGHYTPKPSFINNTFVNNSASDGSAFYIMNGKPFLMNNILWDDHPADAPWGEIFLGDDSTWTSWVEPNRYGDAEVHYSDIQGGWTAGTGNINADPLFHDVVISPGDTMFCCLQAGSPCIDAGNPDPLCKDLDDSRNDMGAYGGIPDSMVKYLTGIDENTKDKNRIPERYALKQNYPNPFNPVTVIIYQIPQSCKVNLNIFNILGQKVATLVSEKQPAGSYKVAWDASGFATGVYLYRLSTDKGFAHTKKLVLLR